VKSVAKSEAKITTGTFPNGSHYVLVAVGPTKIGHIFVTATGFKPLGCRNESKTLDDAVERVLRREMQSATEYAAAVANALATRRRFSNDEASGSRISTD
jgi:hypothetical protein